MVPVSNRTILVVDDEAIIRESITLGLESIGGWKVLQADTGIAGIKAAKKEQSDLILLDDARDGRGHSSSRTTGRRRYPPHPGYYADRPFR